MTSRRTPRLALVLAGALAGCAELPAPQVLRAIEVEAARPAAAERPVARRMGPDDALVAANGECWQHDETPAVIETVTARVSASGAAAGAASGGDLSQSRHRIVTPRQSLWFRAPCPDALTPEILAALQRALAARGLYGGPVTGRLDAATRSALRAYQRPRGLNSARLSLGAARQLGLVAYGSADG